MVFIESGLLRYIFFYHQNEEKGKMHVQFCFLDMSRWAERKYMWESG